MERHPYILNYIRMVFTFSDIHKGWVIYLCYKIHIIALEVNNVMGIYYQFKLSPRHYLFPEASHLLVSEANCRQ